MAINYDDKRFAEVESDKKAALAENEKLYGDMVKNTDQYYDEQIKANEQWGEKQTQLQNEQTDFAIEKIEQQKDQLEKDYHKEQKGAYVDYQKAIDPYGVNAEQMAANGLRGSGYSESSKVAMYSAYQNRVAIAKESFSQAKIEYDNMMKEARLQNSAALAEIAFTTYQNKMQLALEAFQYKNSLLAEKANQAMNIDNMYYGRRQDVINQINTENALAEEKRQFNRNQALQWAKLEAEKEAQAAQQALIKKDSGASIEDVINLAESIGSGEKYSTKITVDKASITALGYGPISASKLDELVSSGEVIEYVEDGKLKYKKANKTSLK